jgi:hypothetical protein
MTRSFMIKIGPQNQIPAFPVLILLVLSVAALASAVLFVQLTLVAG